ncbi:MAG: hypothetical protein J5800_03970 [Spirochaetales bacterium]|nr:hypothetical protein [Spirochaetales bacterium]
MKYVRNKAYENAIQKIRVEFGTLIGLESDEEAYVVLKELPTMEMMQLNEAHEKGRKELLEFFKDVLPLIIVDHNLYETETEKMSNEAVAAFIYEKLDLTGKVIGDYASASFFTQQNSEGAK